MIKQHRLLVIVSSLLLVAALAFWPGQWSPQVAANVTLVSFTAKSPPGQSKVYVDWTTATQFQTIGFYITRSDNAAGPWARVSDFIPREGDDLTGAIYPTWVDEATVLNHFYSYQLEEITSGDPEFYGPVTVIAGASPTNTPTPTSTTAATATRTSTPTSTPTPTATPKTKRASQTSDSSTGRVATPRLATGATITPRPNSSSSSASPEVLAATPTFVRPDAAAPSAAPTVTAPSVLEAATAIAVALPPAAPVAPRQPQSPDPTLVPDHAAAAEVRPVVVVTEAAPGAPTFDSASAAPLLAVAALLFLGLAFVILRQIRQ